MTDYYPIKDVIHQAELDELRAQLARKSDAIQRLWRERDQLRAALTEVRDRLHGHPMYADLNEEQENDIGGDTAEFSYLVRVLNEALK